MIVPTVIFVPSVLHQQVIDADNYVSDTYGKKANPISITPFAHVTPTDTVCNLRECLKTSRFVFCSWSVLSEMSTTSRQIFLMDLALDCLVIEIKENQPVRFAGRKDSVPKALIARLKELYPYKKYFSPVVEDNSNREYENIWSGSLSHVKSVAETEPSLIVDLIPPKVEKPVEIIVKPSLKEKLARL